MVVVVVVAIVVGGAVVGQSNSSDSSAHCVTPSQTCVRGMQEPFLQVKSSSSSQARSESEKSAKNKMFQMKPIC